MSSEQRALVAIRESAAMLRAALVNLGTHNEIY